jgi:hypothetical protein
MPSSESHRVLGVVETLLIGFVLLGQTAFLLLVLRVAV